MLKESESPEPPKLFNGTQLIQNLELLCKGKKVRLGRCVPSYRKLLGAWCI